MTTEERKDDLDRDRERERERDRNREHDRGRDRVLPGAPSGRSYPGGIGPKGEFLCFNCNKPGHLARDCTEPPRNPNYLDTRGTRKDGTRVSRYDRRDDYRRDSRGDYGGRDYGRDNGRDYAPPPPPPPRGDYGRGDPYYRPPPEYRDPRDYPRGEYSSRDYPPRDYPPRDYPLRDYGRDYRDYRDYRDPYRYDPYYAAPPRGRSPTRGDYGREDYRSARRSRSPSDRYRHRAYDSGRSYGSGGGGGGGAADRGPYVSDRDRDRDRDYGSYRRDDRGGYGGGSTARPLTPEHEPKPK